MKLLCRTPLDVYDLMLIIYRYATLSKNGQIEILATQDLSLVQGLNDQELQNAVEELKRSTTAIEKQTEALKLQQNAMASLVKINKRTNQARAHTEKGQVRKWDVERGQINAAVGIPYGTQINLTLTLSRLKSFPRV